RTGETIAFGMPDDRDAPPAEALGLVGSRAGVTVPLLRSGEWQGGFYLSHAEPRNWTGNEIALIEEVAELSWDAVARVRA
ncbi:GAF domain-containing protein, partial [Escherichia coli]|uniref:GAF domain-containing protein n=1 Tax=Escherichia coli TaxID=562 RepID=UPI003D366643